MGTSADVTEGFRAARPGVAREGTRVEGRLCPSGTQQCTCSASPAAAAAISLFSGLAFLPPPAVPRGRGPGQTGFNDSQSRVPTTRTSANEEGAPVPTSQSRSHPGDTSRPPGRRHFLAWPNGSANPSAPRGRTYGSANRRPPVPPPRARPDPIAAPALPPPARPRGALSPPSLCGPRRLRRRLPARWPRERTRFRALRGSVVGSPPPRKVREGEAAVVAAEKGRQPPGPVLWGRHGDRSERHAAG